MIFIGDLSFLIFDSLIPTLIAKRFYRKFIRRNFACDRKFITPKLLENYLFSNLMYMRYSVL